MRSLTLAGLVLLAVVIGCVFLLWMSEAAQ